MNILLITPAKPRSKGGNRQTADRWARLLRGAGHRVRVTDTYNGEPGDLMLALHAWRSAETIRAFRHRYPQRPLIVALTGTDIYRFQRDDPEVTLASMTAADLLIGLHDRVADDLAPEHADKLHVVVQSADAAPARAPLMRAFELCVIGNLRAEKDPLRAAHAARLLPPSSRLKITHLGRAHDASWAAAARAEAADNPRYDWRGERSHAEVRRLLGRAQAMVLSSVMEGGANVVSEALATHTPVLASDIPGNRGLLGDDYPAYFPAGDTPTLAELMRRAERDPDWLARLRAHCAELAPRVRPEREAASLAAAIERAATLAG